MEGTGLKFARAGRTPAVPRVVTLEHLPRLTVKKKTGNINMRARRPRLASSPTSPHTTPHPAACTHRTMHPLYISRRNADFYFYISITFLLPSWATAVYKLTAQSFSTRIPRIQRRGSIVRIHHIHGSCCDE